jgi:hypothetical protein
LLGTPGVLSRMRATQPIIVMYIDLWSSSPKQMLVA